MININKYILEKLNRNDLKQIEIILDKMFDYGFDLVFTKHFLERVNDARNGKEITKDELIDVFIKLYKTHANELETPIEIEKVVIDLFGNLNVPLVIKDDELVIKTIMRKKNFKTNSPKF